MPAAQEETRIAAQEELLELFPVSVFRILWPDSDSLNEEVRRVVLERMSASSGVVKTNRRGGWHSATDLSTWPEPCIQEVCARIEAGMRMLVQRTVPQATEAEMSNWQIEAWANVNPPGAFNSTHNHVGGGNLWSGFYCVDTGTPDAQSQVGGRTFLQDCSGTPLPSTGNMQRQGAGRFVVKPRSGQMIFFPAGLFHTVEPHLGEGLRITLAFNLRHPLFCIPDYVEHGESGWWWRNFRGIMKVGQKTSDFVRAVPHILKGLSSANYQQSQRSVSWYENLRIAVRRAVVESKESSVSKGND